MANDLFDNDRRRQGVRLLYQYMQELPGWAPDEVEEARQELTNRWLERGITRSSAPADEASAKAYLRRCLVNKLMGLRKKARAAGASRVDVGGGEVEAEAESADDSEALELIQEHVLPALKNERLRQDAAERLMEDWEDLCGLSTGERSAAEIAARYVGQGYSETLKDARMLLQQRCSRLRQRMLKCVKMLRARRRLEEEECAACEQMIKVYLRQRRASGRGQGGQ